MFDLLYLRFFLEKHGSKIEPFLIQSFCHRVVQLNPIIMPIMTIYFLGLFRFVIILPFEPQSDELINHLIRDSDTHVRIFFYMRITISPYFRNMTSYTRDELSIRAFGSLFKSEEISKHMVNIITTIIYEFS